MTELTEGTLRHGLRVAVRPMAPGDLTGLLDHFDHLSEESRYRRFMSSKPKLSTADIKALFQTNELALVLVSDDDAILGIAHAIRLADDPTTAEYCICVADDIQGQGAGRLLTDAVAHEAPHRGIEFLTALMLASNQAPARLLAGTGEIVEDRVAMGTREMLVRLP